MVYATSDLHGYPLPKFKALLEKAGFGNDDFLFILGDVIDRNGDGGIETLCWIMEQPNVELLLGNHEAMLLECDFLFDEITSDALDNLKPDQMKALIRWMNNGAEPTLDALTRRNRLHPGTAADVLDFLRDAPLCDTVHAGGKDFVLCHAGLGNFHPRKRMGEYTLKELVWMRPKPTDRYFDDMITVFGHTPVVFMNNPDGVWSGEPLRAVRTETWIDIDTGAAAGEPHAPMLLRLDDMKEFYAD